MSYKHPIFYDEHQKRWPRLRNVFVVLGSFGTILLVIFSASVIARPVFAPLNLGSLRKTVFHALIKNSLKRNEGKIYLALQKEQREQQDQYEEEVRQRNIQNGNPLTIGFFVNWDDASYTSLKENFTHIDILMPEWLHLKDAAGNIVPDIADYQDEVADYIRGRDPNMPIMPLVNNALNNWDKSLLSSVLQSPQRRAALILNLLAYVKSKKFAGISVDFENIPDKADESFVRFIEEAGLAFHASGLKISVNVPPNSELDYRRISDAADYVIVMMYDEHVASGEPGPISGIDWFTNLLQLRSKDISPAKMIVALGTYAYDWPQGSPGSIQTFEESMMTASESEGSISLDPLSLSPSYQYYDDQNTPHVVWMQDAVSMFNQYAAAGQFNPRGLAVWRLGSEDGGITKFLGTPYNTRYTQAQISEMFGTVSYGYDLDYEGEGEILKVTGLPHPGKRTVVYDQTRGLISGESYTTWPSPYVITQYGKSGRNIALTFDDGPDPKYTPQVLQILKDRKAPATFFLIGENVEADPDLVRQEYDGGFEIGNHTFSHPNISVISIPQMKLELSTTARLIESATGHDTLLFRAPFADDSEPETPDQMPPVVEMSREGYAMVGMKVDPSDWLSPPAGVIVSRVLSQVENGQGNIVLLHDSGGRRDETVKALPVLIDSLRRNGYNLVLVSDLIGKTRDDVNPRAAASIQIFSNMAAFSIARFFFGMLRGIFLLGLVLGIIRFFIIGVLAGLDFYKERKKIFNEHYMPSVAVVIAAYNEEKVISRTIQTLLASDYKNFEIVVVDDGSTDATLRVVADTFGNHPKIKILTQVNGGKSSALNAGLGKTKAEIIISLDADTVFPRNTISKLVRHFGDKKIGAVAGNAKVGNRLNILTKFQSLEYIVSQNLDRRAFSVLDAITVVPGAVGAWRKQAVLEAGGFSDDTLAEDGDLTIAIRRLGYSVAYEDQAFGITEAPDTLKNLIKQRFRWMYGTLQVAWKHIDALFNPKYGTLGFIALPNTIIFQVVFPIISPVMDITVVFSIVTTLLTFHQHPDAFSAGSLLHILDFYLLFLSFELMSACLAFIFEPKENKKQIWWLFIQRFYYRQLMYYIALKSLLYSLKGIAVGWNKFERKATVRDILEI